MLGEEAHEASDLDPTVRSGNDRIASDDVDIGTTGRSFQDVELGNSGVGSRSDDVVPEKDETPIPPDAGNYKDPRPKLRRKRLYHMWPGENKFWCAGFAMTGAPGYACSSSESLRDCGGFLCNVFGCRRLSLGESLCEPCALAVERVEALDQAPCFAINPANLFAWVCILVPCAFYGCFAFPFLWTQAHPLVPLGAVFFFFTTTGSLLLACCTDPGILPRREVILATGTAERLKRELGFDVLAQPGADNVLPSDLRDSGHRWCMTCRVIRPPGASHCSDCDNCVLRFDHHCPFINNCVGQRNYIFFMGFTSSVCCLSLWVIPGLIWYLANVTQDSGADVSAGDMDSSRVIVGVLICLAVAAGGGAFFVFSLWLYHVFLIFSGLTTKEHRRGRRRQRDQAHGIGAKLSIFMRRGPKLFNPRSLVEVRPVEPSPIEPKIRWALASPEDD